MEEAKHCDAFQSLKDDCCVTFSLNGKIKRVSWLPGGTTLLQYIRDHAQLKGTKYMCREGGCGACIVNLTYTHPVTGIEKSVGVNSCLFPIYSCHGMSVTTVEGIGNKQKGYHPIQTQLAKFYGSQCGYCTPGWVMAMYSLLKSNPNMSMSEIENSFGSNNCRCTGYRPILDAFKSFAEDSPPALRNKMLDIEDWPTVCKRTGKECHSKSKHDLFADHDNCQDHCVRDKEEDRDDDEDLQRHFVELALAPRTVCVSLGDRGKFYRVSTVNEIFELFTMITGTYMLVGGNTAQGIYENKYPTPPDVYIDINGVVELKSYDFSEGYLVLGANITLTDTINLFRAVSVERAETFQYLNVLATHITRVAHIPVRNVGTLAGNLSTKNARPSFPSDLFTIFETVGAQLIIASIDGSRRAVSLPEFLQTNMYKKVITQIRFLPLDSTYIIKTYKIARRAQNDHAAVNAGFCVKFNKSNNYRVLGKPRIVYGGVRPDFIHATQTENFLQGKMLLNTSTLQNALSRLNVEVFPTRELPETSIEYRKGLVFSLFYRYVLSLNSSAVNPRFRSGGEDIVRPLSSGKQEYYSDPSQYPLTKPFPKVEALIQCTGEIEYTSDIVQSKTTTYASLVLSDRGPAMLTGLDFKDALKIPGVITFYSAEDIPGVNTFMERTTPYNAEYEPLFANGKIQYAGQAIGVVIASSQEVADYAAQRVKVGYGNVKKPVLSINEVIKSGDKSKMQNVGSVRPTAKKENVVYKIISNTSQNGQYHFYYETQTCDVRPKSNNNLEIVVSTQWMQGLQEAVSTLLNISQNRVNIKTIRCGGAYGGKIARSFLGACACALSAYLLQRPVRMVMTLETNMRVIGGRYPHYMDYEVGVDREGVIQYLNAQFYTDKGVSYNDSVTPGEAIPAIPNVYDSSTWNVNFIDVLTDKATTTQARAPGSQNAIVCVEHIMEHIAWTVKKDPWTVRMNNLATNSQVLEYSNELRVKSDYDARIAQCRAFNAQNQWKKRGISMVPVKFDPHFRGPLHALVSVYRLDGTVAITHGGSELGQGINTKVTQVAAHVLGIPLSYIEVKPSNTLTSPNDIFTAASTTGDGVCFAVRRSCEQIYERLSKVRESLGPDATWEELIHEAYNLQINLNATYMFVPEVDLKSYSLLGLTVFEIEIDCLTGEHKILRADIMENVGNSLNPFIDIGQIEGAFLMTVGLHTCEELIFDPNTGLLTTDRTWEYKVPGAKDVPIDWRIYFKKNPDTPPAGIYGSKSVSEAPSVLSVATLFAIRRAIESIRQDLGIPNTFFNNDSPCTIENIFLRCMTKYEDYTL